MPQRESVPIVKKKKKKKKKKTSHFSESASRAEFHIEHTILPFRFTSVLYVIDDGLSIGA